MEKLVIAVQAGKAEPVELWLAMEKFIRSIAHKYKSRAEIDDLMQESYFGLLSAINGYDPNGNTSFKSYSYYWIDQSMRRYVSRTSHKAKIPEWAASKTYLYRRTVAAFQRDKNRKPTDTELCEALQIGREQLECVRAADEMMQPGSLDVPVDDEGETPLLDLVSDDRDMEEEIVTALAKEDLKNMLWALVDTLPEKQAETIRRRYQDGETQKEVGEALGVSSKRIGAIEAAALRNLRNSKIQKQLEPHLDDLRYSMGLSKSGAVKNPTERAALKAEAYLERLRKDGLIQ